MSKKVNVCFEIDPTVLFDGIQEKGIDVIARYLFPAIASLMLSKGSAGAYEAVTLGQYGIEIKDQFDHPEVPWVDCVSRYEDMSPKGKLSIQRQTDGDVIITVMDDNFHIASVEFCAPMTGGGQSVNTWNALRALAAAMQLDEEQRPQNRKE